MILEVTDTPVITAELFSDFIKKIRDTHFKTPGPGSGGVKVLLNENEEETAKPDSDYW